MRNKSVLLLALLLGSCRAHRPVVEIQQNPVRDSSLTNNSEVASSLKITAISAPPQAPSFDRLEVTILDPDQSDRTQKLETYKLNSAIPVTPHKTYTILVRALYGDEVLYSNEYCNGKKSFRSQLGVTLLTVSLCEKASANKEETESEADEGLDPKG